MSLSEIKRKYRQILEEDESACSSEEEKVETIYQKMQKKKQHVMASGNKENAKPVQLVSETGEKEIILLREKLASAIEQLAAHAADLKLAGQKHGQAEDEKRLLERELEQVRTDLSEKLQLIACKETAILLEQEKCKAVVQELSQTNFSMQLMRSQEEFYKAEQAKLKGIIAEKEQEIRQLRRQKSKATVHINQNERLKEDIKRLTTLLAQETRYKTLMREGGADFGLSYLGKPHEQMKNWYPRQLIEDTERFLKSQALGYGNKQFTAELVKHIQAHIHSASRQVESTLTKKHQSKLKDTRRRLNQSLNFHEVQALSRMRQSHISNSRSRRLPKYTTESLLEKSVTCQSKATIEKSSICLQPMRQNTRIANCRELVEQFQQGLAELAAKQPINQKKVGKLCQWLLDSLQEVFKSRKNTFKTSILEV